jgi:probable HAF family extracellular repeat protein
LPGGRSSTADGINSFGQVTGTSDTVRGDFHAFVWQSFEMTDLGTFPDGTYSVAQSINDAGQVVGYANGNFGLGASFHAFLWQAGAMSDLGTLPGGSYSNATSINNLGQVVGSSSTVGGFSHVSYGRRA